MSDEFRVGAPRAKPLMVYDGECHFCCRWIERWRAATGGAVDYLPFQDDSIARQFPEIPREAFAEAVQLILPDGTVCSGAEAVFRSLSLAKTDRWLYWFYDRLPVFTVIADTLYHEVATHRESLSRLDRWVFGESTRLPQYVRVRYIFLRGLALVYLVAFVSLAGQVKGLIGRHGIVSAEQLTVSMKSALASAHLDRFDRWRNFPTLAAEFGASDRALTWMCEAGIALSVAVLLGIAPALALFLLWLIYLSLATVASPFLDFQWDNLLLETGFLAIFLAPLQLFEKPWRQPRPSRFIIWLLRWLIFRLMLESGCVKLLSGDGLWWNLTALRVHFETQPLPTWIGWHAHQLSDGTLRVVTALMFAVELIVPAFIFAGRRPRQAAAAAFAIFQVAILLTGNYTFFNFLTILLCVPLLDDDALRFGRAATPASPRRGLRWSWPVTAPLALVIVWTTLVPLLETLGIGPGWSHTATSLNALLEHLRSFNGYRLFAVMTPIRPEIVLEGSDDGRKWQAYEFSYKPGDLKRRPEFVAPFQPRLDWQMWFAALGSPRSPQNEWFLRFEYRLLQNDPEVTALLAVNPFPKAPPKYLRALLYQYHFTDAATRRQTGEWWRRELLGLYTPPLTLAEFPREWAGSPGLGCYLPRPAHI